MVANSPLGRVYLAQYNTHGDAKQPNNDTSIKRSFPQPKKLSDDIRDTCRVPAAPRPAAALSTINILKDLMAAQRIQPTMRETKLVKL